MNAAGQTALSVAALLVIVAAVTSTKRVNGERAAVLAGLAGEPILVGLAPRSVWGALPFDAVVESVDGHRAVRFASLTPAVAPDGHPIVWSGFAPADDDGTVLLVHVRWAESRVGTRWAW